MTDFILELENLIELDLLHFADLGCHFQIGSFILSIGRISEHIIKLNHCVFKCLDFELLRLNQDEHLV